MKNKKAKLTESEARRYFQIADYFVVNTKRFQILGRQMEAMHDITWLKHVHPAVRQTHAAAASALIALSEAMARHLPSQKQL